MRTRLADRMGVKKAGGGEPLLNLQVGDRVVGKEAMDGRTCFLGQRYLNKKRQERKVTRPEFGSWCHIVRVATEKRQGIERF